MDENITQQLTLLVFQIALLSGVVKLAMDNVRAAIKNPSRWPEITLAVSVILCFAFQYGILSVIMQGPPQDLFGFIPTGWMDFVVTGLAIAGGAGRFADMLKEAARKKNEIHQVKVKNGG
tara:strand:- start:1421 stop:1780 length:360 start_codon:yes stop_codon:yes gene_type:complete